jgi:hypothetical protein
MTPESIFLLTALPLLGAWVGWTLRDYMLRRAQLIQLRERLAELVDESKNQ